MGLKFMLSIDAHWIQSHNSLLVDVSLIYYEKSLLMDVPQIYLCSFLLIDVFEIHLLISVFMQISWLVRWMWHAIHTNFPQTALPVFFFAESCVLVSWPIRCLRHPMCFDFAQATMPMMMHQNPGVLCFAPVPFFWRAICVHSPQKVMPIFRLKAVTHDLVFGIFCTWHFLWKLLYLIRFVNFADNNQGKMVSGTHGGRKSTYLICYAELCSVPESACVFRRQW